MEIEFENDNGGGTATELTNVGGRMAVELTNNGGKSNMNKEMSYLVWQDVSVMLPNYDHGQTKWLLRGLNGFAESGRIMAIMGPSGSGKSTFLDSLSGRVSNNVFMTGNVLFNGKKRKLDNSAYVTQEETLMGTLTVRETITYSAHLRLPTTLTKEELDDMIVTTIMEMGLEDCADRLIGNWHLRGISGGEKKRLSIALEILVKHRLLFLDEPTSGLDSAAAFFVVQALKSVARDGRIVVSSVHQPSSDVYAMFDDLLMLSGGETVYFGDAKEAIKFFAEAGFPCPTRRNPSDHFMRCINSDFDSVTTTLKGSQRTFESSKEMDPFMNFTTTEIKARLIEKYEWSEQAAKAKSKMKHISNDCGLESATSTRNQVGRWKQLTTLTRRSFVNKSRDVGYFWLRIITYFFISISIGMIYKDVGTSHNAILARGACGGFITGFLPFISVGSFPSFVEDMKIFTRERLNGYYGVMAFILSNFISSFPFLVAISLLTVTITWNMVEFHHGFSHYAYLCLNLFGSIITVESFMMIITSSVPNFMMGITTWAGFLGIMMMTSGFFCQIPDLPKPFWRYPISYMNYGSWALQGTYKNDLIGLVFDGLTPGEPKWKGEDVITKLYRLPLNHSKWWDLFAIYIIFVCYVTTFFLLLTFKEKASSFIQSIYAKRVLHRLERRPSFKRFPSSKKHNFPSLSSQEGLNSPTP